MNMKEYFVMINRDGVIVEELDTAMIIEVIKTVPEHLLSEVKAIFDKAEEYYDRDLFLKPIVKGSILKFNLMDFAVWGNINEEIKRTQEEAGADSWNDQKKTVKALKIEFKKAKTIIKSAREKHKLGI